jgi:hypothetical protein
MEWMPGKGSLFYFPLPVDSDHDREVEDLKTY